MSDFLSFLSVFFSGVSSLFYLLFSLPFPLIFSFVALIFCFCVTWVFKLFRG